ncbi:MAG: PSD1 and planctomycete cytochrome C domain-containing protein [Acidobacteria bacterium]|nr:PSD1 and planctomycete cytochrome C domain-containing protein [Acidobacteriota bacterium]
MRFLVSVLLLCGVVSAQAPAPTPSPLPPAVLRQKCESCHGARNPASGFSILSTEAILRGGNKHGTAIVPGHPEQSALLKLIDGDLTPRMPMGGELSSVERQQIEQWIRTLPASVASAPKPDQRWAYEKPVAAPVPEVKSTAWPAGNTIDAFLLAKLEAKGLTPAPAADKRTLVRRLYSDLVGLPPTPAEFDAFMNDSSPKAYETLIDKLLADPRYGERWGRHWLDLARYGETSGLEGDGAIGNAWRYRDWVINAFNQNMPYDQFVRLQIGGGDEHSKTRNNYQPDAQGYIPTAFLRLAPWDRSNLVAAEVRANYLAEVTTATASVFLGLSVGCARCHDHKYDPIPQRDFYRLQAFFQTTQAARDLDVPYKDKTWAERAKTKAAEYRAKVDSGPEKKDLEAFEKVLLAKLVAARKSQPAKELTKADLRLELRLKDTRIFTEGEREHHADLLENADRTLDKEEQDLLEAYEAQLLTKLKAAYANGTDPAKRFEALGAADVRREALAEYSGKSIFTLEEKNKFAELDGQLDIFRRRMGRWNQAVLAVSQVPGPPSGPDIAPARILIRGDYRQPGDAVEPGFLSAITGNSKPAKLETDRYRQFPTRGWRFTLGQWLASRDNPLTARVFVNRVWQHHFGEGIVRTTSDFGRNGDRPSHPELLDRLSVEFMDSGWDVKALHKKMLLSHAYRQAADHPEDAKAAKVDPENRLFWRFGRRRLEAEVIRDSILAVSGRLNLEMGGPSVFPPLPNDLADFARYGRTGGLMWEPNEKEDDARRRSVYIFQRRSLPLPMMAAFDAIPFSESCDRRSTTTTPLQALAMMNGDLVHQEAESLARRVRQEMPEPARQLDHLFNLVLNRRATPAERQQFQRLDATLESAARVLLNSNEFLYVE